MLKKNLKLKYTLQLESGLHIGGSEDSFDIGGADSTVIKNPLNGEPYIPGSTLKGKIRALVSQKYGEIVQDAKGNGSLELPASRSMLLRIFAPLGEESAANGVLQISRGIFRDAVLTEESSEMLQKYLGEGVFTEIKGENSIDPLKGKAANPRFIERVPAGAVFEGEIILQVFDGDDEEEMKKYLLEGLNLLTMNYLGGSGTRGYGRISFQEKPHFEENVL